MSQQGEEENPEDGVGSRTETVLSERCMLGVQFALVDNGLASDRRKIVPPSNKPRGPTKCVVNERYSIRMCKTVSAAL